MVASSAWPCRREVRAFTLKPLERLDFTLKEVLEYVDWVTAVDRDGLPVPRIELERARIGRLPNDDERARLATEFRNALLPRLEVLRLRLRSNEPGGAPSQGVTRRATRTCPSFS